MIFHSKDNQALALEAIETGEDQPLGVYMHPDGDYDILVRAVKQSPLREWWIDLDAAPALPYKITSDPATHLPPSPGAVKVREIRP